jgi:hypothetical protein
MTMPVPPVRAIAPTRRGALYLAVAALAMISLAVVWQVGARRRLEAAVVATAADQLDRARGVFDSLRARTVAGLMSECRVLVEDPRVKASLATAGVDEATVHDILLDILRLRRAGFLLVLSPEGRVFAQAGAEQLRGLDLSGSSVMSRARGSSGSSDAAGGAWVIAGKLVDVAVASVHFDRAVLAYVVVGQAVDQALVKAVENGTGIAAAVLAGSEPGPASTADGRLGAVFQLIAAEAVARPAHVIERDGDAYLAASFDLEGTPPTHPRLAVARALAPQHALFASFAWLLWVPCGLVLLGLMLGLMLGAMRFRGGHVRR